MAWEETRCHWDKNNTHALSNSREDGWMEREGKGVIKKDGKGTNHPLSLMDSERDEQIHTQKRRK